MANAFALNRHPLSCLRSTYLIGFEEFSRLGYWQKRFLPRWYHFRLLSVEIWRYFWANSHSASQQTESRNKAIFVSEISALVQGFAFLYLGSLSAKDNVCLMNRNCPPPKDCLLWINLNSLWTDCATRYFCFILIHFVVFTEQHTIYNPATCLVILHYKQIFILPSGPKVLI